MRRDASAWAVLLFGALGLAGCVPSAAESNATLDGSGEPAAAEVLAIPAEVLSDDQAAQVLSDLGGRDQEAGSRALAAVLEAQDTRFISVLLEILRATEIGMSLGIDYPTTVSALEELSGQSMGANWPAWVEWYGGTDFVPPPGFTGWKGRLLSFIDPRFAEFLTNEAPSRIRVEEILWGGVTVDGIPALDQAEMMPAAEAGYLLPEEPVLGELAATDVQLSLLPVVLTSWSAWQAQHPETRVLALETGFERYYLPGAAYGDYFSSDATMFPVWQRADQLEAKDRIYALRVGGIPKAYPLARLVEEIVVNDTIGDTKVVLVATRGRVTVNGSSLRSGNVTYDAGGEVRAFLRGEETFAPGVGPDAVVDTRGREWLITEEGLRSPDGKLAPRLSGHLSYWFGWFAFFPHTLIYGAPADP